MPRFPGDGRTCARSSDRARSYDSVILAAKCMRGLTAPGAVNPAVNCVLTADGRLGRGEHPAALAAFWPHKYAQRRRLLRISEQYLAGQWANGQVLDLPVDHYESGGCRRRGRALTTKTDHNRTRHEPIATDAFAVQHQVSDYHRQSGRVLQARDQTQHGPRTGHMPREPRDSYGHSRSTQPA